MAYEISGTSTELCSCNAPCPCAFGQEPTGGKCAGIFAFDIQGGTCDGVSLAGTKAIFAASFKGAWTGGNFTAALILNDNDSDDQRKALTSIFSGEAGGDAANLAALVGDMKGVFTAPIEFQKSNGKITVKAGKLAEGAGEELQGQAGGAIVVSNAMYPLPEVRAGKATKSKVDAGGLTFDSNGSGMWTGPFVLKG